MIFTIRVKLWRHQVVILWSTFGTNIFDRISNPMKFNRIYEKLMKTQFLLETGLIISWTYLTLFFLSITALPHSTLPTPLPLTSSVMNLENFLENMKRNIWTKKNWFCTSKPEGDKSISRSEKRVFLLLSGIVYNGLAFFDCGNFSLTGLLEGNFHCTFCNTTC